VTVREVLVVHDAGCGACAGVAGALPDLLRVPVRLRSCRDPELADAYPGLPVAARTCHAPAVGTVGADGTVRWRTGLRAAPALLRLVRPTGLPRAVGVFTAAVHATTRRPWRGHHQHR
jgi:hypothetical protein